MQLNVVLVVKFDFLNFVILVHYEFLFNKNFQDIFPFA